MTGVGGGHMVIKDVNIGIRPCRRGVLQHNAHRMASFYNILVIPCSQKHNLENI